MPNLSGKGSPMLAAMYRYIVVGCTGTLCEWAIFAFLLYLAEWQYLVAAALAFIIATLVNYLLSLRWVFQGGRHARHLEVTLIYLVSGVGLSVNLSVLFVLVEWATLHVFAAKVLASLSAFLWNFTARYFWVFDRGRDELGAGRPVN